MTGLTLVAPILPLYGRQFGVSRAAAGALISAFAFARLLFEPAGGLLADRFHARRLMLVGSVVVVVSSVGAALAPNYGVLLITRVLEGFGSAAFATAAMQAIILVTPPARLGRTLARYQTGLLAGVSIGPILGGYAAELGDFTTPFWLYAAVAGLVFGVVWLGVGDIPAAGGTIRQVTQAVGRLVRTLPFVLLLFVNFALFVARAGARITVLPLFGGEALGLTESQIGLVLAAASFVNILLVNPGGWLLDRVGRRPVLVFGLLGGAAALTLHGSASSFHGLVLVSLMFGFFHAFMGTAPAAMAGDLAPEGAAGAAVGVFRMAGDLGLVVGPIVLGAVVEGGDFGLGFGLAAGVLIVAAVATLGIVTPRLARGPDHRPGEV